MTGIIYSSLGFLLRTNMRHAIVASVILAAASTAGDMLWAGLSLRQRVVAGLLHGALICLLIGGLVGWQSHRTLRGIAAGPVIGFLAAGVFYLLAPWLRYYALFPAWMFFWVCFALLQRMLAHERSWRLAIGRGVGAAIASGLIFYAISGIWTKPPSGGPNYLYNLAAWALAFFPGFAALFFFDSAAATSKR